MLTAPVTAVVVSVGPEFESKHRELARRVPLSRTSRKLPRLLRHRDAGMFQSEAAMRFDRGFLKQATVCASPTARTSIVRIARAFVRRLALVCGLFALPAAGCGIGAYAQQSPGFAPNAPGPRYNGGRISSIRQDMHAQFTSGSCLRGTFLSAATTALEIPGIRVRRDAQFWFHNATPGNWDGNPWHIARDGTLDVVSRLPFPLRTDVLARIGNTTEFRVFYTGEDLIRKFQYQECA